MTVLFKNGRQNSLTPQREEDLFTRPFPKLSCSYSSCIWPNFTTHFLEQQPNITYWKARATWAFLCLSKAPQLCPGCPLPPCCHRHRLGKMAPRESHLCSSTSWGNFSVGYFRSAKIIPATLGKSPGCEIFMLKMENWGQYSYYNFLNSKSLKIKYIHIYVFSKRVEKQLGSLAERLDKKRAAVLVLSLSWLHNPWFLWTLGLRIQGHKTKLTSVELSDFLWDIKKRVDC